MAGTAEPPATWAAQSSRPYHGVDISDGKKMHCEVYDKPQWETLNAGALDSGARPSHL